MQMAYSGSHAVVDVPGAGLFGVKRGEPVEVADAHIRAALKRQGWKYVHDNDSDDTNSDENTNNEQEGDDE